MAYHRTIEIHDACIGCGVSSERDVQIYVGVPDCGGMRIGDRLQWTGSPYVERGGRPPATTGVAYGIGVCRSCGASLDYDVVVNDSVVIAASGTGTTARQLPLPWRGAATDGEDGR